MPIRRITRSIQTYIIDYPAASVLMIAPFRLNFSKKRPVAPWLWAVARMTAFLPPTLADHAMGLVRVIRYWLHPWMDGALGAISLTPSPALHFGGIDICCYPVLAAAVLLTAQTLSAIETGTALVTNLVPRAIMSRSLQF
ncbi:hypothetical protein [Bradyrhizobium sp. CCBAU 51627]|uniref:hypothetical protein n=1 Tax=Bradyrhizobium sp. CCBAU 51627 TaxID=1325088 RepID=UPI0023050F0D|nr:hypothetical protein [Bradyrhizobium sp. CCBAU 51627]MDA9435672.1 hypothetical protein [Bradyrhizobium sp. CCBAU 51627]